jgi:hypothetical protein
VVAAPLELTGVRLERAMEHQTDWRLILCHDNDEFRPFLLTLCDSGSSRERAMTGGLLLELGSMTSSCGDAPVPFSPSMVEDEAEACPDLNWAWDTVKRCCSERFRALEFEQQGFETGVARGLIYRAKELKISHVNRTLSLDEFVADSVEIRRR